MTERPTCAMSSTDLPRRQRCRIRGEHLSDCPCSDDRHEHGRNAHLDADPLAQLPAWELELLADAEGDVLFECPRCDGCLPRQASSDSPFCVPCENRARAALADLPDLFADLAEKPRIQRSRAEATEDMDDAAGAPMEAGRVDARHAIRRALVRAAAVLAASNAALHIPDDADAARASRQAYARHSELASQQRRLAALLEAPTIHVPESIRDVLGLLSSEPDAAAYARKQATRHTGLAQRAWDDRTTGRDTIRALAVHVDRHLATLLADPTAAEVAAELGAVHRLARAKANPSRDDRQRIVCACGAWVTLDAEDTMTCRSCGAWGVLSWWVEQHAPATTSEPMTAQGILDWLLVRHGISVVTLADVRQWAVRFPDKVIRRGKNKRGEQTYEPSADVVLLAEKKRDRRLPRPRPREAS